MTGDILSLTTIEAYLRRVQDEGGEGNFAIFLSNRPANYYVQVAASKGDTNLHLEAVNNEYLAGDHKLDQKQLDQLELLGWHGAAAASGDNFSRSWQVASAYERQQVAHFIERTLILVYGATPNQPLEVELNLE